LSACCKRPLHVCGQRFAVEREIEIRPHPMRERINFYGAHRQSRERDQDRELGLARSRTERWRSTCSAR